MSAGRAAGPRHGAGRMAPRARRGRARACGDPSMSRMVRVAVQRAACVISCDAVLGGMMQRPLSVVLQSAQCGPECWVVGVLGVGVTLLCVPCGAMCAPRDGRRVCGMSGRERTAWCVGDLEPASVQHSVHTADARHRLWRPAPRSVARRPAARCVSRMIRTSAAEPRPAHGWAVRRGLGCAAHTGVVILLR